MDHSEETTAEPSRKDRELELYQDLYFREDKLNRAKITSKDALLAVYKTFVDSPEDFSDACSAYAKALKEEKAAYNEHADLIIADLKELIRLKQIENGEL